MKFQNKIVALMFVAFSALLFAGCLGGNYDDNYVASPLPSIPAFPSIEIPSIPAVSEIPLPSIDLTVPSPYPSPLPTTGIVGIGEWADDGSVQLKVTNIRYVDYFYDDTQGLIENARYMRPNEGAAFTVINFTLKNIQDYPLSINTWSCPIYVGSENYNTHQATGTTTFNRKRLYTKGFGGVTELKLGESVDAEVVFDIPLNATEEVVLYCWDAGVRIA